MVLMLTDGADHGGRGKHTLDDDDGAEEDDNNNDNNKPGMVRCDNRFVKL